MWSIFNSFHAPESNMAFLYIFIHISAFFPWNMNDHYNIFCTLCRYKKKFNNPTFVDLVFPLKHPSDLSIPPPKLWLRLPTFAYCSLITFFFLSFFLLFNNEGKEKILVARFRLILKIDGKYPYTCVEFCINFVIY